MSAPGGPVTWDAVVLAGGRGSRLGGVSKPDVVLAGRTLLDRALDATAGARCVVVVGPQHLARPGVVTVREHPPSGGPVAGLDAGLAALARRTDPAGHVAPDDDAVLVLACDVPRAAAAVPALLAAVRAHPDADGAHLVHDGRPQLVAVHRTRALRAALDRVRAAAGTAAEAAVGTGGPGLHGTSVRRLLGELTMVDVPDAGDLGADADTWDDVARLETVLRREGP